MGLVSIESHKPDHYRRTFECQRCRFAIVEVVKKADGTLCGRPRELRINMRRIWAA